MAGEKSEGQDQEINKLSTEGLTQLRREKTELASLLEKQYQQVLGQLALIDELIKSDTEK